MSWNEILESAQVALKESRFFDGVQAINSCMVAYAKVVGDDSDRVLREPGPFLEEHMGKFTKEQSDVLQKMYEVRGDIINGLGAYKRAIVDYQAAQKLGALGVEEKLAKAEAATEEKTLLSQGDKVPVTVLTGFLGSGKTTLLNNILREFHGKRLAIIENEFGEVGIDDSLIETGPMALEENVIEMNNGCICCTVRGDLIAGLKKILKKSIKDNKKLDGVIIETTGLADPAPVAQTFFADEFVQQNMQ